MSNTYARPPPLPPKPGSSAHSFRRRSTRLSLGDYQPLTLDRDALQAAYRDSLRSPSKNNSARSSWAGTRSSTGLGTAATTTTTLTSATHQSSSAGTDLDTLPSWDARPSALGDDRYPSYNGKSSTITPVERQQTARGSSLSHELRSGDNPHRFQVENMAGIGAGHALTPPDSPEHSDARNLQRQSLVASAETVMKPPTPPYGQVDIRGRPGRQAAAPALPPRPDDAMDIDPAPDAAGGQASSSRRELPNVPTNVPVPTPPAWERFPCSICDGCRLHNRPDYKSHIPASLTAPSVAHAYAQLSAPPPGPSTTSHPPPPRRVQPYRQASAASRLRQSPVRTSSTSKTTRTKSSTNPSEGPLSPSIRSPVVGTSGHTYTAEPGQIVTSPVSSTAPAARPFKPARPAEPEVTLVSRGRTPIWSTHFIDPHLRSSQAALHVSPQVTNVTNIALSGLSSGPKTRYNSTTGAPIDGMASAAKGLFVKPDACFHAEDGAVELAIGVVDARGTAGQINTPAGKDPRRKRARVEVSTRGGGVKVDLLEIDPERQVDLTVSSKTGDVLILLPEDFLGPIHVTSIYSPKLLSILQPHCEHVAHPYATFYTTFITPLSLSSSLPPEQLRHHSTEHRAVRAVERYVPGSMREQSDLLDQVVGGYVSHTRGEHSKVSIKTKGRVAIGYRKTKDEQDARLLGLNVGVEGGKGTKKKKWWQS